MEALTKFTILLLNVLQRLSKYSKLKNTKGVHPVALTNARLTKGQGS